jgi:hypothetical protein
MDGASQTIKCAHGGSALGTEVILRTILSFLTPFDVVWCREVCRWWRALLRYDRPLSEQIWRNYAYLPPWRPKVFTTLNGFGTTRRGYWMYAYCVRHSYWDLLWYMWLRGPELDRRHLYQCVHQCRGDGGCWEDPLATNVRKAELLAQQWWDALYVGSFQPGQKEDLAELSARVLATRSDALSKKNGRRRTHG